jgi:DNA (cytosine-5)-methyltransferase 1
LEEYTVNYLSICSGIEAASVAWHNLGWKPLAFSEIEKFPSAVLAHHWPDVPNLGDMTKYNDWPTIKPELVVGGTPCQAFSIAGLRKGLADPRGNLTLTFLGILAKYRPKWVVWENVPGVLSDRTGAFGSFLSGLSELGYGFAYRILDAQHFGVPQRRRRVFVVGCLGSWASAAAVLFESESLRWNHKESRDERKEVARCSAPTVASGKSTIGTLMANSGTKLWLGNQEAFSGDYRIVHPCNDSVSSNRKLRRLTPIECERLQGFPDDHTLISWNEKPADQCPDGPRYKAIGNSMAVPVMSWIGERIQYIQNLQNSTL